MLEGLATVYARRRDGGLARRERRRLAPDRRSADLSIPARALLVPCEAEGGADSSGAPVVPPATRSWAGGCDCAVSEVIYETRISSDAPSFIRQHRVLDHVILPAAAYLDMLVAARMRVLRAESSVSRM